MGVYDVAYGGFGASAVPQTDSGKKLQSLI